MVVTTCVGHRAVLKISGPLGTPAADAIGVAFWDAVEKGAREIWLDIGRATTVRPQGLDALARCADCAHELNCRVAVIHPLVRSSTAIADACRDAGMELYGSSTDAHYHS